MIISCSLRASSKARLSSQTYGAAYRRLWTGVGTEFLDIATGLPWPTSFPPYASTIILATIAIRTALLPFSIWSKQREYRMEFFVAPELRKYRPTLAPLVFKQMQQEKVRGDKEFLQQELVKRCTQLYKARQRELCIQYRCRILPTVLIPPLIQIPPFVAFSLLLGRLAADPTSGFDSESFFTLSSLSHPDPTMVLPVLTGLITFANIEASTWLSRLSAPATPPTNTEGSSSIGDKQDNARTFKIRPTDYVKSIMRLTSPVRIILTAMVPGGTALYWTVSATYGLLQTWVMDWYARHLRRNTPVIQW